MPFNPNKREEDDFQLAGAEKASKELQKMKEKKVKEEKPKVEQPHSDPSMSANIFGNPGFPEKMIRWNSSIRLQESLPCSQKNDLDNGDSASQ